MIEIVDTVNSNIRDYDFGIHRAGCADVARALKSRGVNRVTRSDETPEEFITREEAELAAEGMEGFTFRVFPCCREVRTT